MENIIKEIQSMLISQFGYPWNVEYDSSVATVSMVLFCKLNDAPVVTLNDAVTV